MLQRAGEAGTAVPAASTITGILRRGGLLECRAPAPEPFRRFEALAPDRLWQMDLKGHCALDGRADGKGERCFPLTVLDDHSRYRLGAQACRDERDATVRERLTRVFERHGLPGAMITDNGNPPAPEAWRATEGFDQALGLADPPRHRALVEPPPC